MPIYEYQCQECGRRTEALQRLNEPPLSECPHCGGPLRKLVSAPAFQFKGSGWYVTDYARKGGGEAKEGDAKGGDQGGKTAGESGGKSGGDAAEGGKEGGGKAAGAAKPGKAAGSAD